MGTKSHRGRRASSFHSSSSHLTSPFTQLQNPDQSFHEDKSDAKKGNSQRLLTALRRNSKVLCVSKEVKKKEEEPDIWAALRDSKDGSKDNTRRNVLIPGGVFVGKFHESVVSHCNEGSSSGRELKERF